MSTLKRLKQQRKPRKPRKPHDSQAKKKRRTQHNDETKRLAEIFDFTAKDIYANKRGKFTQEQIEDLIPYFNSRLLIGGILLAFYVLFVGSYILNNPDPTQWFDTSGRRGMTRAFFRLVAVPSIGVMLIVHIVKQINGKQALRDNKILRYVGNFYYSRTESGRYLKFGSKRWQIDPKHENVFQPSREYTMYYINQPRIILSVEASDPAFYDNT